MFIVGVDIAKRSHEAIILDDSGSVVRKAFNFKNDSAGFTKLTAAMTGVSANPEDFIVGMESTGHYWLALYSALRKRGYTVHVLNPIQSNALRGMYIRQVKNDEHDSFIIAEVIRFGRYTEGGLPPSELYELRELCRARTFVVDMTADLKRKVIALLDQAFPEYETIFSDIFGLTSSELLLNCSTPEEILAIDTERLAEILEVPSRKRFRTAKAEQIKEAAANSFGVVLEYGSMGLLIKQYMEHIRYTEKQIAEIENKISELYSHFNSPLTTIPGIGPTLAAAILSEIGDISRFSSATKLAAFAGIDPTVKQSGEFTATHNHMSKRGSPYLRRAIWQASTVAVNCDPTLKAFMEKKRAEGKSYMNAIGHVTRKLTNIIYAVLRDNKPYYPRITN
ncbi:MAG: IS110 family transposase [Oscillospiraceae bacterium]|nr:IS110 family transposase [Oscillospiraceae bacterium]